MAIGNNRRKNQVSKLMRWFGDQKVLSDFLKEKPWTSLWGFVKVHDSFFRALGMVVFASNPLTGSLIFAAMSLANPLSATGGAMAGIAAILLCKLMKAADADIRTGVAVFNSILTAAISTCLIPVIYGVPLDFQFWIMLAIAGCITTFVDQGFQSMMAPSKLPVQSVPFNFVTTILFLVMKTKAESLTEPFAYENLAFNDTTDFRNSSIQWINVFRGTVLASGQVYGVETLSGSILIWLGYILYSPLLTIYLYSGSVIGALMAIACNVPSIDEVYLGIWSFNSMLAAGAISFFVVPTPLNPILALVSAILAISTQVAITPVFTQAALPVLSYPFNITIMIVLAISLKKESAFKFVFERTFPEEHICRYYGICGFTSFDEESPEEEGLPLRIRNK